MNYAMKILENKMYQLQTIYIKTVVYGTVKKDSQHALLNRLQARELQEALETLQASQDQSKLLLGDVSCSALLNELLDSEQEIISSPIRFNGVHIETIKQIFGKYGVVCDNKF